MIEPSLVVRLQADGFSLNVTTLAVITALVGALAGAVTVLHRALSARDREEIKELREERDILLDKLFDLVETADRSQDAADEATKLLLRKRPTRRTEPRR